MTERAAEAAPCDDKTKESRRAKPLLGVLLFFPFFPVLGLAFVNLETKSKKNGFAREDSRLLSLETGPEQNIGKKYTFAFIL
jgi:hypothetical protein